MREDCARPAPSYPIELRRRATTQPHASGAVRSAEVAHLVQRFAPLPIHVGVAATLAHEVEQMHEAQVKVE